MRTRGICKRCHRLRVVDDTRYCAACADTLDEMSRPRPRRVEDKTKIEEAPTEPAPKPEGEDTDD